jgi:hypothetical protein
MCGQSMLCVGVSVAGMRAGAAEREVRDDESDGRRARSGAVAGCMAARAGTACSTRCINQNRSCAEPSASAAPACATEGPLSSPEVERHGNNPSSVCCFRFSFCLLPGRDA